MSDLTTLFSDAFPLYKGKNIEIAVGLLAVAIYSWSQFNKWVGNEINVRRGSVPQHYTDRWNFFFTRLRYVAVYLALFVLILAFPDFSIAILTNFEADTSFYNEWNGNIPLMAAFLIIVTIPITPGLKHLEGSFRHSLHVKAMIPAEATRMFERLRSKVRRFTPEDVEIETFIRDCRSGERVPNDLIAFIDFNAEYGSLKRLLAKLLYLDFKIRRWKEDDAVVTFFQYRKKAEDEFDIRIESIITTACNHFNKLDLPSLVGLNSESLTEEEIQNLKRDIERGFKLLNQNGEEDLRRRVIDRLDQAYEFISCGILATAKSKVDIQKKLRWFGFYLDKPHPVPPSSGVIVSSLMNITWVTFTVAMVGALAVRLLPDGVVSFTVLPNLESPAMIAVRSSVLAFFLFGSGILAAYGLWLAVVNKGGARWWHIPASVKLGSKMHYLLAGIVGFITGLITFSVVIYKFSTNVPFAQVVEDHFIWAAISAATAFFGIVAAVSG